MSVSNIKKQKKAKRSTTTRRPRGKPFQKGKRAGPGRPPGALNAVTRLMKDAICEAAELAGNKLYAQGKCSVPGTTGYFEYAALKHPTAFLPLAGRMLPMQADVRRTEVRELKTVGDLRKELAARGLPVNELLPKLIAAKTLPPPEPEHDEPEMIDVTPADRS